MEKQTEIFNNVVYKVVSGSRMYGVNSDDSDEDTLGAYILKPENMLGVTDNIGKSYKSENESDANYKAISNFISHARAGSSFWVETLFTREQDVLIMHPLFEPILKIRHIFLTQALVHKSLGFMRGMVYDSLNENIEKTKSKNKGMYHAVRVGNMILEMFETGDLRVHRPDEREHLLKIKNGEISLTEANEEVSQLFEKITQKRESSNLIEIADENILNKMVSDMIIEYWRIKQWI